MILISAQFFVGHILPLGSCKVAEDILDFLELALEAAKGPEEDWIGGLLVVGWAKKEGCIDRFCIDKQPS